MLFSHILLQIFVLAKGKALRFFQAHKNDQLCVKTSTTYSAKAKEVSPIP